jgi:hypothetical protein
MCAARPVPASPIRREYAEGTLRAPLDRRACHPEAGHELGLSRGQVCYRREKRSNPSSPKPRTIAAVKSSESHT